MSLKFDLLLTILNKLDNGETVTNRSIMDDLEISERSAYRYMESLAMAEFPVWYDRRRKSYAFTEGYRLKKLDAGADEVLALALARKVMAPFGSALNGKLESLGKKLSGHSGGEKHIVIPNETIPEGVAENFLQIHRAIVEGKVVEISYQAVSTDKTEQRMVEPAHLFFSDGYWYLRAYCRREKVLRTFGLDRIRSILILDSHFNQRHPSPEEDLKGAFGSVVDGEPTEVVVRFGNPVVRQIQRRQWHPSQQETILDDGSLEVRFIINGTDGIKRWIYRWLPWVEVVAPNSFRRQVASELRMAASVHSGQVTL